MVKLQDYKGTNIEKAFDNDIQKNWSPQARAAALAKRKMVHSESLHDYDIKVHADDSGRGEIHITHKSGLHMSKTKGYPAYGDATHKAKQMANMINGVSDKSPEAIKHQLGKYGFKEHKSEINDGMKEGEASKSRLKASKSKKVVYNYQGIPIG